MDICSGTLKSWLNKMMNILKKNGIEWYLKIEKVAAFSVKMEQKDGQCRSCSHLLRQNPSLENGERCGRSATIMMTPPLACLLMRKCDL